MAGIRVEQAGGKQGRIIPLRLLLGTELMSGLRKVREDNSIWNRSLLTVIDGVRKLTIQVLFPGERASPGAAYKRPVVYDKDSIEREGTG